jgi:hypothetical protein
MLQCSPGMLQFPLFHAALLSFPAIFLGLQRYFVPTTLAIVNRTVLTAAVLAAVALHSSLAVMGAAVAMVLPGSAA